MVQNGGKATEKFEKAENRQAAGLGAGEALRWWETMASPRVKKRSLLKGSDQRKLLSREMLNGVRKEQGRWCRGRGIAEKGLGEKG